MLSYSFLRYSSKKRIKRSAAVCTSSAKNHSRFPKARKLASCACSNSPRFLTENFPDFLHATDVRTESLTQHRFARWLLLCPRIQNSGPPAPKAGVLNELLWITHNSLHHPLIIAQHQLSTKKRFRPHWSSVKKIRGFYR